MYPYTKTWFADDDNKRSAGYLCDITGAYPPLSVEELRWNEVCLGFANGVVISKPSQHTCPRCTKKIPNVLDERWVDVFGSNPSQRDCQHGPFCDSCCLDMFQNVLPFCHICSAVAKNFRAGAKFKQVLTKNHKQFTTGGSSSSTSGITKASSSSSTRVATGCSSSAFSSSLIEEIDVEERGKCKKSPDNAGEKSNSGNGSSTTAGKSSSSENDDGDTPKVSEAIKTIEAYISDPEHHVARARISRKKSKERPEQNHGNSQNSASTQKNLSQSLSQNFIGPALPNSNQNCIGPAMSDGFIGPAMPNGGKNTTTTTNGTSAPAAGSADDDEPDEVLASVLAAAKLCNEDTYRYVIGLARGREKRANPRLSDATIINRIVKSVVSSQALQRAKTDEDRGTNDDESKGTQPNENKKKNRKRPASEDDVVIANDDVSMAVGRDKQRNWDDPPEIDTDAEAESSCTGEKAGDSSSGAEAGARKMDSEEAGCGKKKKKRKKDRRDNAISSSPSDGRTSSTGEENSEKVSSRGGPEMIDRSVSSRKEIPKERKSKALPPKESESSKKRTTPVHLDNAHAEKKKKMSVQWT